MAWYRMNGMMVHLKLSGKAAKNPPAPCCARLATSNPIVPAQRCCAMSEFLCDAQLPDGKTCDAPVCREHATQFAPDRHLCQRHARLVA